VLDPLLLLDLQPEHALAIVCSSAASSSLQSEKAPHKTATIAYTAFYPTKKRGKSKRHIEFFPPRHAEEAKSCVYVVIAFVIRSVVRR
jgi:hypothetical protein